MYKMDKNYPKINKISSLSSIVKYKTFFPKYGTQLFMGCGARLIGNVTLGDNVSLWFNSVVRGDVNLVRIGSNTNIQDGAVVHCTYEKFSTSIGENVSIGHLAIVHGCEIQDNCLIGMGSVIMDGAVIGTESIVGASAVVTQGTIVPPRSLVLGAPGKVVRSVTLEEIEKVLATTKRYLEYANGYDFS
jgi:gamma-carbonic anhydrase